MQGPLGLGSTKAGILPSHHPCSAGDPNCRIRPRVTVCCHPRFLSVPPVLCWLGERPATPWVLATVQVVFEKHPRLLKRSRWGLENPMAAAGPGAPRPALTLLTGTVHTEVLASMSSFDADSTLRV